MNTFYGRTGIAYQLESQLGRGGEGVVYSLKGNDSMVAKIYNDNKFHNRTERSNLEEKLKTMIAMNIPSCINGVTYLAWPKDILYDRRSMKGFIMPAIDTRYKLYDIYRGGSNSRRDNVYPNYTWKYSVQFAYHLSWIVEYLHMYNIVIGDFNQNNIVVDTKNNTIVLIDCDSFDITNTKTGQHFPCTVGLPEMLAPELQDVGSLTKGKFSKESDYFSLAIHIFRLLMNNADPFGGIITMDGSASLSDIPVNKAILNGECAYVREVPNKKIPDWSLPIEMLPEEIITLFDKTFHYTALNAKRRISNRATAKEWRIALEPYGKAEPNPRLGRCSVDSRHVYPSHNKFCPWCGEKTEIPERIKNMRVLLGFFLALALAIGFIYLAEEKESIISTVKGWFLEVKTIFEPEDAEDTKDTITDNLAEADMDVGKKRKVKEEYILPGSDSRYIQEEELENLTKEEIRLARNEIYARHGRKFGDSRLQKYFESTSWYEGIYEGEEFDQMVGEVFNEYEEQNIRTIVGYEEKMGY